VAATLIWFHALALPANNTNVTWPVGPEMPYWLALAVIGLVWLVVLDVVDTRDEHMVGHGTLEYQRIVRGSLALLAVVIASCFFLRIEFARTFFFIAVPAGTLALLISRWLWRQWLRARQRNGAYVHRVVVLGERAKVAHIVRTIRSTPGTGYEIIGALTKNGRNDDIEGDVQVSGSYRDTERVVEELGADTVIFAGADDFSPKKLRRLGWAMADRNVHWVVAPALTDIAGPRIHSQPVAGLPLIHVSYPVMEGSRRFIKRASDIIGSSLLILLFSPVMLAVAIAVKTDSKGPLFYQQERIGRRGLPFGMLKFRSMIADADDQLASLLDLQGTSDQPLFKVNDDPRITRVGHFLRRHSLDELPQLFNVFTGEMSLVGPRPQREGEVALYDDVAHRRLLVKPGMSGLWQVSGRSSLSWDDALRLDLYYVENWSFTQDLLILFRTIKAVIAPGADAH
jgi:exopolysaccharide biosynthesis polyprenyl glycosylphosphotransferase